MLAGDRTKVELEHIPGYFLPHTGRYKLQSKTPAKEICHFNYSALIDDCPGLDKIFVDDDSYNSGHGHAYESYGCSSEAGALVVVRPDQRTFTTPDAL